MTFPECVMMCAKHPSFVSELQRLGALPKLSKSPIEIMVDRATGFDDAIAKQFVELVFYLVWSRISKETPP